LGTPAEERGPRSYWRDYTEFVRPVKDGAECVSAALRLDSSPRSSRALGDSALDWYKRGLRHVFSFFWALKRRHLRAPQNEASRGTVCIKRWGSHDFCSRMWNLLMLASAHIPTLLSAYVEFPLPAIEEASTRGSEKARYADGDPFPGISFPVDMPEERDLSQRKSVPKRHRPSPVHRPYLFSKRRTASVRFRRRLFGGGTG